jgi:NAD-dependent dihydropyrimidine dehydrogenase PreA subunit
VDACPRGALSLTSAGVVTDAGRCDRTGACAEACPAGAIKFGNRAELLLEAKKRLEQNPDKYVQHIYGEHEAGGTNHLYLAALPFEKLGLPKLEPEPPAVLSEKIQHNIYTLNG